jgi:drug/metabolite transporter (DMT)-like permease
MTTGIAAVILTAVFWRQMKRIKFSTVKSAFILSLLLTAMLLSEKKGLEMLPSSNASFLSSLTILAVPLLMLIFKVKPTKNNIAGAGFIVLGLCLTNRFSLSAFLSPGTLFMLLTCLCSAVYIIAADRFTKKENPLLVCVAQMIFTAMSGFLLWLFENPATFWSVHYTNELLSSIFILAFFTKAYAYIALMFSQKYADPMSVTVIASTEPVVTLMLAVLIPAAYGSGEKLGYFSLAGATVIAGGAMIAGSSFISKRSKGGAANGN